jgi:hypothetical protein
MPPTATAVSPTDTPELPSCEQVEGTCLELIFDGKSCTYVGPSEIKSGPVTLLFFNDIEETGDGSRPSDYYAHVNLLRHMEDKTIQDMIDYLGEEPSTKHHPSWSWELGTWKPIAPGDAQTWKGVLELGIHTLVCARINPFGVWYGGGFTVED